MRAGTWLCRRALLQLPSTVSPMCRCLQLLLRLASCALAHAVLSEARQPRRIQPQSVARETRREKDGLLYHNVVKQNYNQSAARRRQQRLTRVACAGCSQSRPAPGRASDAEDAPCGCHMLPNDVARAPWHGLARHRVQSQTKARLCRVAAGHGSACSGRQGPHAPLATRRHPIRIRDAHGLRACCGRHGVRLRVWPTKKLLPKELKLFTSAHSQCTGLRGYTAHA